MSLLFIEILPENHTLIFEFSRKVAKFQNLLTQPSKPTLKESTHRVLGTFYRACVEHNKDNE